MKYIDSGGRSPTSALGSWLQVELNLGVSELRLQSGFFSVDGLSPFVNVLRRLAIADGTVNIVIGSNEAGSLEAHVSDLVTLLGLPRAHAHLGVVSYAGAFFHPKTYHMRRDDGSQAAYVGSANLTLPGIGALHVEAGLLLDTREGDPSGVLDDIAKSVDDWFQSPPRAGLERILDQNDVTRLTAAGVLSSTPKPRIAIPSSSGAGGTTGLRPRLTPLIRFPAFLGTASSAAKTHAPSVSSTLSGSAVPSVPLAAYPPYALFAPGATTPTTGVAALSGFTLPSAYSGLVYPLTKDSGRLWQGGQGTANISVPAATVNTLRFGRMATGQKKPRAEFPMELRFLTSAKDLRATPTTTNVMLYGYGPGATGHKDIRMLIPKAPVQELNELALAAGISVPKVGDPVLLEWPIKTDPTFRLSFLEPGTTLAGQASTLLSTAKASNQLIGSSCWLPHGVSPIW